MCTNDPYMCKRSNRANNNNVHKITIRGFAMFFSAKKRTNLVTFASAVALGAAAIFSSTTSLAAKPVTWKVQYHWHGASSSYKDSLVSLKSEIDSYTYDLLHSQQYAHGALF